MFKKVLSLISASAVIATSVSFSAFAAETESAPEFDLHIITEVAEDNPSEYGYVNYKYIDENGNEVKFNLIPEGAPALKGTLPSKYSLLDEGYLPAIRNQGAEGTCWAHAGMAMAETSMIKQKYSSAATTDFSEKHLAWFAIGASAPEGDPLYGDFSGLGTSVAYNNGGNMVDVMFTLMAWIGAEQESNVPYANFTSGVDESYRYHSSAHLQNVNRYDSSDITSIKQAIMRDGAVQISYYQSNAFLTTSNSAGVAAYYCPYNYTSNHSITVVGWDDNFSADNFTAYGSPSTNGAWLCRNSYGTNWGSKGYFFMSYEETTIGEFASLTMEPATNYGKVYQYDGGCLHENDGYIYSVSSISGSGLSGGANVFTASANDELTAVSYYTPAAGWKYKIKIYNNLTGSDPSTGTLVSAATVSGTANYAGYHTVALPTNVAVKKGQKFAVCVDLYDSEGTHYVITDRNNPGSGLSYFRLGGWYDCYDYYSDFSTSNVRVKAYTKYNAATKPTITGYKVGDYKVKLEWKALEGAEMYRVYTYRKGAYTRAFTCDGDRNVATVTGLNGGLKYGFVVSAKVNGAWTDYSDPADLVYAVPTGVTKPTITGYKAGDYKVKLEWTPIPNASMYRVYTYANGVYTRQFTCNGDRTVATVTGLNGSKTYSFVVSAKVGSAWSDYSDENYLVSVRTTGVRKPAIIGYKTGDGKVKIEWEGVKGAEMYRVYTYANGVYTRQFTCDSDRTVATVSGLKNGKQYAFTVSAKVNGSWTDYTDETFFLYAIPNA